LIFVGKKTRGERFANQPAATATDGEEQQAEGGFPDQGPAHSNIAVGEPFIPSVEPSEEQTEQAFGLSVGRKSSATMPGSR